MPPNTTLELVRDILAELRQIRERLPTPVDRPRPRALSSVQPSHPLRTWLSARDFEILSCREDPLIEGIYDQVALVLGKEFHHLRSLLRHLRRAIAQQTSCTLNLPKEEPHSRDSIIRVCQLLEDRGLPHPFRISTLFP